MAAPKRTPCVWQHPFVDVFKTFSVDSAERRGDIAEEIDKQIGKRVYRIRGQISANSFLQFPGQSTSIRTLGLTGQYVYLQIKALGTKYFLVHFDLTVQSTHLFRITLSNMYTQVKATYHAVQCPCKVQNRWTVVCVNVPAILASCTRLPPHTFALKSIQLCASLYVRNLYTSDIRYTPSSLPREMLFDNQASFEDRFEWIDVPGGEAEAQGAPGGASLDEAPGGSGSNPASGGCPDCASTGAADGAAELPPPAGGPGQGGGTGGGGEVENGLGLLKPALLAEPLLRVRRLIGVSKRSRRLPDLAESIPRNFAVPVRCTGPGTGTSVIAGDGAHGCSRVLVASSMTLKLVDPMTREERCFFGHTEPVELLEASADGLWAASVQGRSEAAGAAPLLRLWRCGGAAGPCGGLRCVSQLSCPGLSAVRTAAFGPGARLLALAGLDMRGRQQLLVWDISRLGRLQGGGSVPLLARQTSADWDIDCVKFSPFEEQHLVTCGRECIRFWRIKDGHLPGCNVVLNSLARQSHFTCLAFELIREAEPVFPAEAAGQKRRVFVGTAKGKLLQLSYNDRKVQAVYDLHTEAITAICAAEGLLITASADKYVKVWPLDFQSYIHAMHETPVVGVDITADGSQVICSTLDGSVGLLDMHSHGYTDLVRSHGARISDAAVSLFFQELATASCDGTLKVWSLTSMMQTHEFGTPGDVPQVVAFHPGDRHLVAVGFQSGTLRIFDVDGPAVLCEHRHYAKAIVGLLFVADRDCEMGSCNAQIVTCDALGAVITRNQVGNFQEMRCLERKPCTAPPEHCNAIACAPPSFLQYQDVQCAALLSFPEFELLHKLRVPSSSISTLGFSFHARLAMIGTADSKLYGFEVATGSRVITYSLASGLVSAAALAEPSGSSGPFRDTAVLLAATADARLRVWQFCGGSASGGGGMLPGQRPPWISRLQSEPFEQSCIGHASAPQRVLIAPRWVVTVSPSEVICWAVTGNYFEQLFLDDLMERHVEGMAKPEHSPLPDENREQFLHRPAVQQSKVADAAAAIRLDGSVAPAACGGRARQPDGSAARAVLAERSGEEQLVEVLQESTVLLSVEGVSGEPDSILTAVASPHPAPLSQLGGAGGSWPGTGEEAAGATRPAVADQARTAAADLSRPYFAEGFGPMAAGLLAPEAPAPGEPAPAPREPPAVELRPLDKQVGRGDDLKLCSVSGCVTTYGSQTFAWQPSSGLLCHTVGCVVHVERLRDRIGAGLQDSVPGDDRGTLLADLPGLDAFALDMDPQGGKLLAVLSFDAPSASGQVWLSLWCLETMARRLSALLPESYAPPARARGARPLLRLFGTGKGAVTAVGPSTGGPGRVDIWKFEGDTCSLSCSAEPPFPPSELVLLSKDGSEFLTLCARTVVFWCCSEAAPGRPRRLMFQVTEEPLAAPVTNLEDAFEFTSFCLVELSGWQLLLVATTHGRLWAYNADENLVLAELALAPGERIEAVACAQWPALLCAVGDQVRTFTLLQGAGDILQAEPLPTPPLTFDGQVQVLSAGSGEEGVACTAGNTLWYFHTGQGIKVPLQSFHTMPSRALCSNVAAIQAGHHEEGGAKPAKVLATCADDGSICTWDCDSQHMNFKQAARLAGEGLCTALTFLRADLLVCAFTSGHVRAFELGDLWEVFHIEVGQRDPVLALEAISPDSVLAGSASGQLVQISLMPNASQPTSSVGVHQAEAAGGPRQRQLQAPQPGSTVCRIERDHEAKAGRFLACFASLELWIWDCPSGPGCRPRHTCTWVWPESKPKPWPTGSCGTAAACLELLASPPMAASFIMAEGCNLVAVTAPPAPCIYIYSCTQGSVVNRLALGPQLPRVLRLWSPPPLSAAEGAEPEQRKSNLLLVLSRDRFSRLRVSGSGTRAVWLEDPLQIPGASGLAVKRRSLSRAAAPPAAAAAARGTPDVCVLTGKGGRQCLVMKSDSALSCWVMA